MNAFELRTVTPDKLYQRQLLARWREHGVAVDEALALDTGARYVVVEADGGRWRGLIDPRVWLAQTMPALARLASAGCDDTQLLRLLAATHQPLTVPVPDLAYQTLHVVGWEMQPTEALPSLPTSQGRLWLSQLPAGCDVQPQREGPLPPVLVPLTWALGYSWLSLAAVRRVVPGDVLLITTPELRVSSHGVAIGHYVWQQQGILMDTPQFDTPNDTTDMPPLLSRLPVKLEFILQQRVLRLDELRSLYQGQVLPLTHDAERHIEVRANGVCLARGELVQLDEQLGVEISALYPEALHE
ncbi:FliM/FliN family flagellar motor switch protein [Chromobacterium piscinae]|uniref:Surface presentation of antigens protein SpaO n=1 Tax=Chromobacterium piscinae TaxID=686831 RepID=A0ABV0HA94_9NEIS